MADFAVATFQLRRRLARAADESWPSFFQRCAQHNYLRAPSALRSACQARFRELHLADSVWLPTRPEAFAVLAELTWLSETELYAATAHIFAPNCMPVGQSVRTVTLGTGLQRPLVDGTDSLTPLPTVKYCPRCLAEGHYHRLAWLPRLAAACLTHQCLLAEACPRCGASLDIPALLAGRCPACQAPLAEAETQDLAEDSLGLLSQRQVQRWLRNEPGRPDGDLKLVDLAPRAAYQLLCDLATVDKLMAAAGVDPFSRSAMAAQYARVSVAFTALLDWPQGFYALLEGYRQQVSRRRTPSGPAADLGPLYRRLLRRWQHEAFGEVQQAMDAYFVQAYDRAFKVRKSAWYLRRPDLAAQFRYITYTEAAAILKVAPQTLSKLVRLGRLGRHRAQDADHWLFERAEVARLAETWSATLTVESTAAVLGLSRSVVRDLIRLEELVAERGPTVDETAQWRLSQGRVEGWHLALVERTWPLVALEGLAVDLVMAAQMLAVVGLNAASTLRQVRLGNLPAYGGPASRPGELLFLERDLVRLVEAVKHQQGWVDRETIARRMGVKLTVVTKWTRAGLLVPVATHGPAQYFEAAAVEKFIQGHVFTETAAALLGVGSLTVQRWARHGKLKPVSGPGVDDCLRYLFPRETILAWCSEELVSAPELARRLGMSHSQVLAWTHEGKLQPVSGPGVDQCKHYLFRYPIRNG